MIASLWSSFGAPLWSHISAGPLLPLTLTLAAYLIALAFARKAGNHPIANPVLIAVVLVASILTVTHTSYATYFQGTQSIQFLLGPATVALAVPLVRQLPKLKRTWLPLCGGLIAGSVCASLSAVLIARAFGAPWITMASLAPKSVTTPIAMAISEKLGGLPSLTAVLVIAAGIFGAVIGPPLLRLIGIRDNESGGFAMGLAAHGIGTARAFQINAEMGAFAGLGMGLNGIFSAIAIPVLMPLLSGWLAP